MSGWPPEQMEKFLRDFGALDGGDPMMITAADTIRALLSEVQRLREAMEELRRLPRLSALWHEGDGNWAGECIFADDAHAIIDRALSAEGQEGKS